MASGGIEFRILGPLEVRIDGAAVAIGGPRQRALLALLLLNANRVVSRDRLLDELMNGGADRDLDRALRVQASRLCAVVSRAADGRTARSATPPPSVPIRRGSPADHQPSGTPRRPTTPRAGAGKRGTPGERKTRS